MKDVAGTMSGGMSGGQSRGNDGCSHNIPPPTAPPFFPLIYELKAKHPSSDDPGNGDHCRNHWALPLDRMMDEQVKEREAE